MPYTAADWVRNSILCLWIVRTESSVYQNATLGKLTEKIHTGRLIFTFSAIAVKIAFSQSNPRRETCIVGITGVSVTLLAKIRKRKFSGRFRSTYGI